MSRRLTDIVIPMIDQAVDRLALGDDVTWEFTLAVTPQGCVGMVFLYLPSGIIGETLNVSMVWSNPVVVTQDQVDDAVGQMLEGLRTARSQQLVGAGQGTPSGIV